MTRTAQSESDYENYYLNQIGNGLPAFMGSTTQRGHGVGNILKGLFRMAAPLIKTVGKAALKQAKPLAKKAAMTALTHGINAISNSQGRRARPIQLKRQRPIQPIRRKPKRVRTVKGVRRVDVFDIDSKLSNITLNESTSKKGSCQCEFESDLMSITITFSLNTI